VHRDATSRISDFSPTASVRQPGLIAQFNPVPIGFAPGAFFDVVFASKLLEHLHVRNERNSEGVLRFLKRRRLLLIQPNFRTSFRRYFDDYTISDSTDTTSDLLNSSGFACEKVLGRFLRFPKDHSQMACLAFLLLLPVRPFAGRCTRSQTENCRPIAKVPGAYPPF